MLQPPGHMRNRSFSKEMPGYGGHCHALGRFLLFLFVRGQTELRKRESSVWKDPCCLWNWTEHLLSWVVTDICNPDTLDMEAGGSEIQRLASYKV